MTRILVVRHAQSTWNAAGRWQGRQDPPLSEAGRAAARAAGAALPGGLTAAVASPQRRAADTAALLAPHLAPLALDDDLRERAAGPWEGLSRTEIDRGWPGALRQRRFPEGWEADEVLAERALRALGQIAGRHPDGHVLVVTHGGLLRALEAALGLDVPPLPNLAGRALRLRDDGGWTGDGDRFGLVGGDPAR